jgi:ribosomal protein S18 acetylase RimI-like enzyme
MDDRIAIRTALMQDAPAIARLIAMLATDLDAPSTVTPEYVAEVLREGGCTVLLAQRGGAALGMLSYHFYPSLYHAADSCLVDELVVEPAARGQGVGALLLEAVIRRARERGCAEVSLSVMSTNKNAQRFYERHGFEADAVFMEQHLTAE